MTSPTKEKFRPMSMIIPQTPLPETLTVEGPEEEMKPIPSHKPGLSRQYTPERLEKGKEKETKRVSPTTQKRIEEAKQRRKERILSRGPSGPSTPITGK